MLLLFAALTLDALFSSPTLAGAHTGALVIDAANGHVVYARNADDAFVPASTMKLLVGSAAFDRLGDAFSFVTSISVDGTRLYVKGGGDPTLGQAEVSDAVNAVTALNLNPRPEKLAADVSRYTDAPYPDGWQVDDLAWDYAAPVSALAYAHNTIHITLTPGSKAGEPVHTAIAPSNSVTTITNDAVTGAPRSEDTSTVSFDWSRLHALVLSGSIPMNSGTPVEMDAAALDPPALALDAFASAFFARNAPVEPDGFGVTPPSARVVWQHRSQRLPDLVRAMWWPSDNLFAETFLEELGVGAADTRAAGIESETKWLQSIGVDTKTITIGDGCGMSIYDRVTPRALVTILTHDWNAPQRAEVLAALPVAGKAGDLRSVFAGSPLVGNVIAKTGSVRHARNLAGYLQTPRGTLIFALMVNNWMDSAPDADARLRAFQQAFLTRIRDGAAGVP